MHKADSSEDQTSLATNTWCMIEKRLRNLENKFLE